MSASIDYDVFFCVDVLYFLFSSKGADFGPRSLAVGVFGVVRFSRRVSS